MGPCHCLYIFVPCLAFRVHVAGNPNQKISFVVGILSTSLALYSGPSLMSPSCPLQFSINLYQIEWFWSNEFAYNIGFEFQSNGQFPFANNLKRTINYREVGLTWMSLVRREITGVIIALWRTLRHNGWVLMRTSYSLFRNTSHRATVCPARIRENGNFSDSNL